MNMRILIGLSLLCVSLLQVQASWAASYSLPAATFPPCSGTWNQSQNSCNDRVVFGIGDTVTASSTLTITADAGFTLSGNNTLGSSNHGVSLKSTYGSIVVRASGNIFGAIVSDSGEVDLTGTQVSGSVTGSGNARFKDSKIGGLVQRNNGISANNTEFQSGISVSNGSVDLTGGKVQGDIQAANGIKTNLVDINGAINSSNGAVELQGGEIKGNVTGGCCKISLSDLRLIGDIRLTNNDIELDRSEVVGNITTTNRVHLKISKVWGNVTAATWDSQTIKGTGNSEIYGVCKPADTTPQKLCQKAPAAAVHHYRLSYSSQALTCQPHPVTLQACSDDACSQTYQSASTVTLSPAGWVGGSTVTFTGSTSLALAIREERTAALGITEPASAPLRCYRDGQAINTCALTFADSGLLVSVPPLIAGKPDTLTISAVRKSDNSPACIPAFANVTRPVQLWGRYIDPGPTEQRGNKLIQVGGQSVDSTPVTRNLAFNANGQAQSSVRYDDAGKMQLDARYQGDASRGDAGLVMEGNTQFVSRPYGLHISHDASCNGATVADCAKLVAAGDPFPLRIRAVAWTRDNQPRTASELAGNPTTPSFRLAGITLGSSVVAPAGGAAGSFSPGSYSHALGEQTEVQAQQSEVGIFKLTATPPPYFGHDIGGSEALVGRFVPAYLEVSGLASMDSCDGISYQREKIKYLNAPRLTVTARNRSGAVTGNYDLGDFWRLSSRPQGEIWAVDAAAVQERLLLPATLTLLNPSEDVEGGGDGDGKRSFVWNGDGLSYALGGPLPGGNDLPVSLERRFSAAELMDADDVCARRPGEMACLTSSGYVLKYDHSEIRLGRLRIDNASGSELADLALPWTLESWQAPGVFRASSGDSCSAAELGAAAKLDDFSGVLKAGDTTGVVLGAGTGGEIKLTAPGAGKTGSVNVGVQDLPEWLHFDWKGAGREPAAGIATFGIYQGPQPLIFRRELYR